MRFTRVVYFNLILTPFMASALGPVQSSQGLGYSRSAPSEQAEVASGAEAPLPIVQAVGNDQETFEKFEERVQNQMRQMQQQADPEVPVPLVGAEEIKKRCVSFDNIIVINKAPGPLQEGGGIGQTATAYKCTADGFERVYADPTCKNDREKAKTRACDIGISTGQEAWVCDRAKDSKTNVDLGGWNQVWTGTRTGYFPVDRCEFHHLSGEYADADMPYACFFDGGRATHQGMQPDLFGKSRASHGCVRTSRANSRMLFELSVLSGGVPNPESLFYKEQCNPSEHVKTEECQSRPEIIAKNREYRQMIMNLASQTNNRGEPLPAEMPIVPVLTQDGHETGATKRGFKTLVIVECIDKNLKDCSKTKAQQPKPIDPASDPQRWAAFQNDCQNRAIALARAAADRYNRQHPDRPVAPNLPPPLSPNYLPGGSAPVQIQAQAPQQQPDLFWWLKPKQ